jgi:hypothetical protein
MAWPERTYVVSLQTRVLARVDAKKYAKEIQANVDWLKKKAIYKNDKLTGWSYPLNPTADNSNTHFAVMALHAAAQAGAKVDAEIWNTIRAFYTTTQKDNGGWAYNQVGEAKTSYSMTLGGLLGLAVAAKYDKDAKKPDEAFEKGMNALLGGKVGEFSDCKSEFVSWMTAAELGRVIGSDEFKLGKLTRAWYREGAEYVVTSQQKDGSLTYLKGPPRIDTKWPIISTACGLYVLGPPRK